MEYLDFTQHITESSGKRDFENFRVRIFPINPESEFGSDGVV